MDFGELVNMWWFPWAALGALIPVSLVVAILAQLFIEFHERDERRRREG